MLPRKVIAGPAVEPLSLEEAKGFLRITTDAEDATGVLSSQAARLNTSARTEKTRRIDSMIAGV